MKFEENSWLVSNSVNFREIVDDFNSNKCMKILTTQIFFQTAKFGSLYTYGLICTFLVAYGFG